MQPSRSAKSVFLLLSNLLINSFFTECAKLNGQSPMPPIVTSTGESNRTRLYVYASINYGAVVYPYGPMCSEGMRLALKSLQRANVLPQYELAFELMDDQCLRNANERFIRAMNANNVAYNRVPLTIGPVCPLHVLTGAEIKYYNFIGVAAGTVAPELFQKRQLYRNFFILEPPKTMMYNAAIEFIEWMGWHKIAVISETTFFWQTVEQLIGSELHMRNMSTLGTAKLGVDASVVPSSEVVEAAVKDLSKISDARIILVNSNYAVFIACWLHRYKIYGPEYVFLVSNTAYFLANDQARYGWCTQQMLLDVLDSTFVIAYAYNININSTETMDSLGMSGDEFESELKTVIDQPEVSSYWWDARCACYEQAVFAGLVLNGTENYLNNERNETLVDWVTSGAKFQENGRLIESIIKDKLMDVKYRGLIGDISIDRKATFNTKMRMPTLYQVQRVRNAPPDTPLALLVRPVPVATYELGRGTMKPGRKFVWKTKDNLPPPDSVRYLDIKEPAMASTPSAILQALAAALLFLLIALIAIHIYGHFRKNEAFMNSLPHQNATILFGNIIMLLCVFILPVNATESMNLRCMIAYFFVNFGLSLTVFSFVAKMQVAFSILNGLNWRGLSLKLSRWHLHPGNAVSPRNSPRLVRGSRRLASPAPEPTENPSPNIREDTAACRNMKKYVKIADISVVLSSAYAAIVCILWFVLEPLQTEKVSKPLEPSLIDINIVFHRYTYMCTVPPTTKSTVFLALLGSYYLVMFLRALTLAIALNKKTVQEINDLNLVSAAAYCIIVIVIAGGAILGAFFSQNGGYIEIGISAMAIAITTGDVAIIFAPKLKKDYYL